MSLKETISIWNEAVILYDSERYKEAIEIFRKVPDQSAKIVFNIGSVCLLSNNENQALTNFTESLKKDPFLAIAYFQRGCTNLKLTRYHEAEKDFQSTLDRMRGSDLIDYRQLGLSVKLFASQVLLNQAIATLRQGDEDKARRLVQQASRLVKDHPQESAIVSAFSSFPNRTLEIPPKDSIFRPPKSVVANLQKKDFLGKAKVISSVAQNDNFVGFEGARKSHSNPTSPTPSRRRNQLYVDDAAVRKGSLTPPPPTRPPPKPPLLVIENSKTNPRTKSIRPVCHPTRAPPLLNGHGASRSNEELRLRSNEGSRPPPPRHAPPVLGKSVVDPVNKVKPQRPPPPVLQRKV